MGGVSSWKLPIAARNIFLCINEIFLAAENDARKKPDRFWRLYSSHNMKYSLFFLSFSRGDSTISAYFKPSVYPNAFISSITLSIFHIFHDPPFPTSNLPTSNCGFTREITWPPELRSGIKTGNIFLSEINDTSMVIMSTFSPISSKVSNGH